MAASTTGLKIRSLLLLQPADIVCRILVILTIASGAAINTNNTTSDGERNLNNSRLLSTMSAPFIPNVVRTGVAVYTVYCGPQKGSGDIVHAPNEKIKDVPHYYLTDNKQTHLKAQSMGWKTIRVRGSVQSGNDANLKCKIPRTLPSLYEELDAYEFLVYIDSKVSYIVNEVIYKLIDQLKANPQWAILFHLHPRHTYGGPRAELREARTHARYKVDYASYVRYILARESTMGNATTTLLGTFNVRKMNHVMVNHIGLKWYGEILASGVEDQISLPFVYKRYKEHCGIMEVGWQMFR
jgi:hypothetical protein